MNYSIFGDPVEYSRLEMEEDEYRRRNHIYPYDGIWRRA